jgi:hypothetical protein
MRFQTASTNRSSALRSKVYSLAKICSIGLGEVRTVRRQ